MWILVPKIFVGLKMPIWQSQILGIFSTSRFGIVSPTKILCTNFHIYTKFPVNTGCHWWKIITLVILNLSLKIFGRSTVIKLVLEFQIKFGAPKPWSITGVCGRMQVNVLEAAEVFKTVVSTTYWLLLHWQA